MKTHNTKRILSAIKRKRWGFAGVKGAESYHRGSINSIHYQGGSYQLDKDDGLCQKRPLYGVHFEPDEELTLLLPYYKEGGTP